MPTDNAIDLRCLIERAREAATSAVRATDDDAIGHALGEALNALDRAWDELHGNDTIG